MTVSRLPAGPKGHLLRGNLPEFMDDRTGFLTNCARDYGDLVPLRFGPKRAVLLSHPDMIEQVLVTNHRDFGKPYVLRTDRMRVENRPTGHPELLWSRAKLAKTVFHRTQVAGYGEVMVAATERMLEQWRDGETRDIVPEMMRLALVIVGKTLFGTELAGEATEVSEALHAYMEGFVRRLKTLFLIPEQLPTPGNRRLRGAQRRLDEMMDNIITQQLDHPGCAHAHTSGLFAHLPDGGQDIDREQLRQESMTFFLAGHETVALSLSWAWYLISQHPEVEAKLHEELRSVLGGRPPSSADRPKLVYTEMIVQEVMRLFPPLWVMARIANQDGEIDGYPLPAGTLVMMSQWVTHRDARFYERPEQFEPERWAGDAARQRPRFSYFPFGGGPRGCSGSGFAMLEAVLILATVAQRFRLSLAPGAHVEPEASITLRPKHGISMRLRARQDSAPDASGTADDQAAMPAGASPSALNCPHTANR